nr:cyclopropane-fatty-acyl-phospholipid synthase family protein [Nakamurella alba]
MTTAGRLAELVGRLTGGELPIGLRAWDGSTAGPTVGPVLVIHSRRALRRLLWSPGELGLAEAYVAGDVDVEGDLAEGLSAVWSAVGSGALNKPKVGVGDWPRLAAEALRLGAVGPRPPAPGQASLQGRLHSKDRDRAAIAHHYDLSNDFYELLLDDSMAYSCAYFTDGPSGDLAAAQKAKLDLVCHKLGLHEGSRHLDIGCGWGSLICHAAAEYGTVSTGVTLSRAQYEYVSKRVAAAGLADRVTVRHADYRELADDPAVRGAFDAVSTIEMGEHVGDAEYPAFTQILHDVLRPGGRALVQQMSHGVNAPGGGAFIETYIAPDMHMKSLGTTVDLISGSGLEVRDVHALREHYDWTVRAWHRTLEDRWDDVVDMIGEVGARVWRLYLVGGALAFAENRMGVDQILAVRPGEHGVAGMPASRKDYGW